MKSKVVVILKLFLGMLKNERMGLEIYKDGTMVFVDMVTRERVAITAEDLKEFYDSMPF